MLRIPGPPARTCLPHSGNSLAKTRSANPRIQRGCTRCLLDYSTHVPPLDRHDMRASLRATSSGLVATLFLLLFYSPLADAHVNKHEAAGFFSGLRHPVSGLDHIIAMIAVGLWGAQLGAPSIWLLPVAFPMVMAFGGMLGLMGVPLPGAEIGIAASAILLGVAVMLELRPKLTVAAAL